MDIISIFETPKRRVSSLKANDIFIQKNNAEIKIVKENKCEYLVFPYNKRTTKRLFACLCRENHYPYFEDYLDSLDLFDVIILYKNMEDIMNIQHRNIKLIFILDLDENMLALNLQKDVMIFCIEQMTILGRYNYMREFYKDGYHLISHTNAQKKHFPNTEVLPYQYQEDEVNKLKTFITSNPLVTNAKYEYDVCMIGCNSDMRHNIFNELVRRGVRIVNVEGWKDIRDRQVARCKILLNVHFHDDYQVYEHLHCDRWMFAGKLIISEKSLRTRDLQLRNVIFIDYEELVDTCIRYIREDYVFSPIESIIEERRKVKEQFLLKHDIQL